MTCGHHGPPAHLILGPSLRPQPWGPQRRVHSPCPLPLAFPPGVLGVEQQRLPAVTQSHESQDVVGMAQHKPRLRALVDLPGDLQTNGEHKSLCVAAQDNRARMGAGLSIVHMGSWFYKERDRSSRGERAFNWGGGGRGRYSPLARRPPSPKKGSIDGPPKILPRLTPGPCGDLDTKFGEK